MNPNTLSYVLQQAVQNGWATSSQTQDVLNQRSFMDSQRSALLSTYAGQPVAAAQNQIFVGTDVNDLYNQVQAAFPGAVMYTEEQLTANPVPVS